ncbi:MAG: hypothetical protein ACPGU6_03665 [Tenacibaculum sp.]
MKKLSIAFFALVVGINLMSCNGDDIVNETGDPQVALEQNEAESNKIAAAILEEGVLINGATKKSGNPPSPNSNLNFQLNKNKTTALQKNGINIKFSSSADIAGAYIRFKDVDGNGASSYFNVPADVFESKNVKKSLLNERNVSKSKRTNDTSINVDFTDVIPAGVFCYDICIYDSANNISAIQSVCVTVESWGGNSNLVGNWIFVSSSEDDYEENINCNNGNSITVLTNKIVKRNAEISFEENGSYNDHIEGEDKQLDWVETEDKCEPVYRDENDKYESKRSGNWAYDQRNNKLSIVMFKYQDILYPSESFEKEDGELITDALTIKKLTSDTLIIEETLDFNGGNLETLLYTFKRK